MQERQRQAIEEFVSDRTPRPLMGQQLTFDLPREADKLRNEETWRVNGHNARTLLKHSEFRLVLIVLAANTEIDQQTAGERLAVQTLRGKLDVVLPTSVVQLGAGGLVALDRDVPFSIRADEPSEVLLWVGWSGDSDPAT